MEPLQAKQFVDSLARFGMRFGLERMHRALEALGHPERRMRVLHVAGTNGKGSTCATAAALLRSAGERVGLYTSPHLVRVNERIQVDGQEIPDEAFAEGAEEILRAFPEARGDDPLTFFEFGTLLALWHFARERVGVAVLECGLGGRLDATNAVRSEVAVVTRIGLDHMALLGRTLAEIAGEKAGIFKPGAQLLVARQPPEALAVLVSRAEALGGSPRVAGRDYALEAGEDGALRFRAPGVDWGGLRLALPGPHQVENAETAIEAARLMRPGLDERVVREGLASVRWPGRMELVDRSPPTLLDGAHNPDGARALAEAMRALHPGARIHLVFGVLGDKDVTGVAEVLLPLAHRRYLCSPRSERALPVADLAHLAQGLGAPGSVHGSVEEALSAAREAARAEGEGALVLVAGSLYVVGEARPLSASHG